MNLPTPIARLDARKLQPGYRHTNAAICQHEGRLLCAYRVQQVDGSIAVGICRLDKKLQPARGFGQKVDDRAVVIDAPAGAWIEDPRLCVVGGRLVLLVAQINHGPATSVAKVGRMSLSVAPGTTGPGGFFVRGFVLDGATLQPVEEIPLAFGHNNRGRNEKNWMPFELPCGGLGLVYSLRPHIVIEQATGAQHQTPGITRWRWGTLSGRTQAILLPPGACPLTPDACYLAIIGGHVPHPSRHSRYWIGAYTFSATAPHAVLGVSREPLLWADDRAAALLNLASPGWNPVCLFPAGLVLEDVNTLLVSAGVNDSYVDFLRLELGKVLESLVPPDSLTGEETVTPAAVPVAGQIRVRVVSKQPVGELGGPYRTGQEFNTTPARAAALGSLVEVVA